MKPESHDPIDYERFPESEARDETDVNLRAYLASLSEAHLHGYDPDWPDGKVMEWDGNFRSDGALMLVCCERDVGVREFRRALETHIELRRKAHAGGTKEDPDGMASGPPAERKAD